MLFVAIGLSLFGFSIYIFADICDKRTEENASHKKEIDTIKNIIADETSSSDAQIANLKSIFANKPIG